MENKQFLNKLSTLAQTNEDLEQTLLDTITLIDTHTNTHGDATGELQFLKTQTKFLLLVLRGEIDMDT